MQEKFVVEEFFVNLPKGRFLEVGANDGNPTLNDEPVWGLKQKGWEGVYVEPNPSSCANLLKNIGPNRPEIQVVNCAISQKSELKTFYSVTAKLGSTGTSSFQKDWITFLSQSLQNRVSFITPIIINTITFDQLFDYVGDNFDFISIDTENTSHENDELIQSINFARLQKCKMLMIESISDSSIRFLQKFNYIPYKSKKYSHSDFNFFFVKNF